MNAVTPIITPAADPRWEEAVQWVNAWRGRCVQCFAKAEGAVSETLLALAAVPGRGDAVRLRRLVGQRFEDLSSAIGGAGPFATEGGAAALALEAFRQHEPLRPVLCHGIGKVALDRQGQWLLLLKLVCFRGREPERTSMAIEQQEAAELLADLEARGRKLSSALGAMRSQISRSSRG